MKSRRRNKPDPIEHEIELALSPGEFIRDRACFSFVSGLEKVAARIDLLMKADAARATTLCEAFLAGCHEKAEELDDFSGNFGMFAKGIICRWIEARQALGAGDDVRFAVGRRLVGSSTRSVSASVNYIRGDCGKCLTWRADSHGLGSIRYNH